MPRSTKPQISFADWELLQQGIVLEPLLQNISDFLDDHEELIEPVRRDLQRGLKNGRALQDLLYQAAPRYVKALKRERDKTSKKAED